MSREICIGLTSSENKKQDACNDTFPCAKFCFVGPRPALVLWMVLMCFTLFYEGKFCEKVEGNGGCTPLRGCCSCIGFYVASGQGNVRSGAALFGGGSEGKKICHPNFRISI